MEQHVMSHVVTLDESNLHIGPFPMNINDVSYLIGKIGIQCFVNLLPLNPEERTKTGCLKSESYKEYLDNNYDIRKLHLPINTDDFSCVTGKTVAEKQAKEARLYIFFGEKLLSMMKETGKRCFYIHYKTGFKEEVIIGFLLWKLMHGDKAPSDPCEWIAKNEYKLLLDNEPELRQILMNIWSEINAKKNGISKFFVQPQTKKIKK